MRKGNYFAGNAGLLLIGILTAWEWPAAAQENGKKEDQPAKTDATTPAEQPGEKATRYHSVLVKRPGSGYLFDRFYDAWLETGTISGLEQFLTAETEAPDAGTGDRLLLAYFFVKQGDDARALKIFGEALKADPENAEAWFEKAKIEGGLLNFEQAIADLGKAEAAGPEAETQIEIAKLKGRLLLRSGDNEAALEVWKKLLAANQDDEELHEDVLELQIEEGLYEEAIATSTALVERTDEAYEKVLRSLRTGDIYQRAGKREEALKAYEASLEKVGHGAWIEKEILAQIDRVFRREDDVAGLRNRLEKLTEADGGRLSIRRKLAEVMMELGDSEAAIAVFEEILKLTPGDRTVREAFIALLTTAEEYEKAIAQMKALMAQHPGDAELWIGLAAMQEKAGKGEAAGESLAGYLEKSDGSEYVHLRTARLQETYQLNDDAEATFRKLLSAFPESVAARETFAAFLHRAGRKEEAVGIWRKIAEEGDGAQAIRIARTLTSRQELNPAFEVLEARYEELQNDPVYLGQLCDAAARLEKYEEAAGWARRRVRFADDAIDLEQSVRQAAMILSRGDRRDEIITELQAIEKPAPQQICLLAELLEQKGDYDAVDALLESPPENDADAALVLAQKIRTYRQREQWIDAAEAAQQLIELPGNRKSAHIRNLVELYGRAREFDEALGWIPEWKQLSPGGTEPWLQESVLLAEANKESESIEVLREAARKFEGDETVRSALAQRYIEAGKLEDARRIYLGLYEESEDLSGKMQWVGRLSASAQSLGKIDQLIEEFESRKRNNRQSVAPLMALAEIFRTSGDYEERRKALLEATRLKPDDTGLLNEIARIEETEGDWEAAIRTLEKARPLDKTSKTRERIAALKLRYGDEEEAYRELAALARDRVDADSVLQLGDAIAARRDWERVSEFLEPWLEKFPKDYRIHYLNAVALEEDGNESEAIDAFITLLGHQEEIPGKKPIDPYARTWAWRSKHYPEGMKEFTRMSLASYQAYQHRQGNRTYYSPYGLRAAAATVSPPHTVDYVLSHALIHLRTLSDLLDSAERDRLIARIEAAGVRDASIYLGIELDARNSGFRIPEELLDEHPDHLAIQAIWLSSAGDTADIERLERAFKLFEKEFPTIALNAGFVAARGGDERGPALLDRCVALLDRIEEPGFTGVYMISSILGGLNNQGQIPMELSAEQREKLTAKLVEWYPETARAQNQQASWAFFAVATALQSGGNPEAFVNLLEDKIDDHRSGRQTGNPWAQYMNQGRSSMIGPLPFPPLSLERFPGEVLMMFLEPGQSPISIGRAPPDESFSEKAADLAEDPVLNLLLRLRSSAGDEEIGGLLSELTGEGKKDLDGFVMAAGWAARNSDYAAVIDQLSRARFLPMSRTMRRTIDGAIVHATVELDPEENSKAREEGQAAALRLRHGRLLPNQRQELAGALESLGLSEEAEKQEQKVAASTSARQSRGMPLAVSRSGSSSQPKSQIETYLSNGKRDQAVRAAAQLLRARGLEVTNPQSGGNWRYNSQGLRGLLAEKGLTGEVLELLEKETGSAPGRLLEFAGACEIMSDSERAIPVYRKVLESRPKDTGARYRLATLLAPDKPDEALELILDIDPAMMQMIAYEISNAAQNDDNGRLEKRLGVMRLLTGYLESASDRTRQADWSWAQAALQVLAGAHNHDGISIPHLYTRPEEEKEKPDAAGKGKGKGKGKADPERSAREERTAAVNQLRRELHDEMCRAMLEIPQLAGLGFAGLATVARIDGVPEKEIETLAAEAIEKISGARFAPGQIDHRSLMSDGTLVVRDPFEYLVWRAWEDENEAVITEKLIPELSGKGSAGKAAARKLEQAAMLYFCEPSEFSRGAGQFIRVSSASFWQQAGARMSVLQAWKDREMDAEAIRPIAIETAKQHRAQGNYPQDFCETLVENLYRKNGPEAAAAFLDELTELWLGPLEKREETIAKNYNSQNNQQGSLTQLINSYGYFCRSLSEKKQMTFFMVDYCDRRLIPRSDWPYVFRRSNSFESPESILELIEGSPLLAESPTEFRVFPASISGNSSASRNTIFDQVIYGLTRYAKQPVRAAVLNQLKNRKGFGPEMIVAAVGGEQPRDSIATAAKYADEIQALPEKQRKELIDWFVNDLKKNAPPTDLEGKEAEFLAWIREHSGTGEDEQIEQLLAAGKFADLKMRDNEFSGHVRNLMARLESDDRKKAAAVFYKACELIAQEQRSTRGWSSDEPWNGWTTPGEILDNFGNGTGFDRIPLIVDVLMNREPILVPHSGWSHRYGINQAIRKYFDEQMSKNSADVAAALTATFRALHEKTGGRGSAIIGLHLWDFFSRFNRDQKRAILDWADTNRVGKPFSPLAAELAMVARFHLAASPVSEFGEISDPEAWQAHYLGVLQDDESYTASFRLALGHHLFSRGKRLPNSDIARTTAELAAESLGNDEIPFTSYTLAFCLHEFYRLERDEQWDRIAATLMESWKHRNRFNGSPRERGKAYDPVDDGVFAVFQVAAKSGNEEFFNRMRSRFRDNLNDQAGTLVVLVENGLNEKGAEFFRKYGGSLQEKYERGIWHHDGLEEKTPSFLERIENPADRYLAEILLANTPDPPLAPGETRPKGKPAPRAARLIEVAKRFESIDFENSGARERCIAILAKTGGTIPHLGDALAETFEGVNFGVIGGLDDYEAIRNAMRLPAAYAIAELRKGNSEPFLKAWNGVQGGSARNYYRWEGMKVLAGKLDALANDVAKKNGREMMKTLVDLFGQILEDTEQEIMDRGSEFSDLTGNQIVLAALAGGSGKLDTWRKKLDPAREKYLKEKLKGRRVVFSTWKDILNPAAPGAEPKPKEERFRIARLLNADSWVHHAYPYDPNLFQRLVKDKVFTAGEIAEIGPELIEAFPRNGFASTDLAKVYADEKKWDEAIAWSDRALSETKPPPKGARLGRMQVMKCEILRDAGRRDEAAALLKKVSLDQLPPPAKKLYRELSSSLEDAEKKN